MQISEDLIRQITNAVVSQIVTERTGHILLRFK